MFFVEKTPTTIFLIREKASGKYMGFDRPSVYWTMKEAEFAIGRQQGRRQENIEWEIVTVSMPK